MSILKFVLLLTIWTGGFSSGQQYSGPNCLGPFCIDRNVPISDLLKRLGPPTPRVTIHSPYCYQSGNRQAFLYVETFDSEPKISADIFLSDFPNCFNAPKKLIAEHIAAWATREGVKLGSSEEDVLRAYGKPSSELNLDSGIYKLRILGHQGSDQLPKVEEIGEKRLFYNGDVANDLRAAEFGIRRGKVSYIWLSHNE